MAKKILKSLIFLPFLFLVAYAFAQEDMHMFTNFTAGELTRKLDSRVDFDKLFNGARTLENMLVYPQGGAAKRPGFKYIATTEFAHKKSRLIPFVYSDEQAYMLEFGEGYIHFYMDGGLIQSGGTYYEVATSFTEDDLPLIKYTQSADVLYLVHPDYPQQKLMRSGHTDWNLQDVSFQPGAISEQGHELAADLILNQTAVSGVSLSGVSAHSSAAVFNSADEGRYITCEGGRALISGVTDASHIQVTIVDAFSSVTCYQTEWTVEGSPIKELRCYPEHFYRKGQEVYFAYPGAYIWRTADIGKFVLFEGGAVRITAVTILSAGFYLQAWGEIVTDLDENRPTGAAAYTYNWTLNSLDWTATNGYPSCVEFFEQRLFFAGSAEYPQTIWGSVSGDYENFTPGIVDDDSISFTIASDRVNVIRWIKALKKLLIGTTGGEWWMSGPGSLDPITPADKTIRRESTFGSQNINSIIVDNSALFVQKPGKRLRRYAYNYYEDSFKGQDLTVLAEHLTDNYSITELAYQQSPNQIVWAIREDGTLLGLTYMPEEKISAWHRHETEGDFESVAVIPGDDRDEVWVIVKRYVDDVAAYRFVEQLQSDEWQYTWDEKQMLLSDTALHPTACCTDPDDDRDVTTDWLALSARLTSEPGGITENRLKVYSTVANGYAYTADFSMTAGEAYRFKVSAGADVGNDYRVFIHSSYGFMYDSSDVAGAGAGNWDTVDKVIICPSTQTDWAIYLRSGDAGENAYFDNVSLYEYIETTQTEIDNSLGFFVDVGLTYNDEFEISGVTPASGVTDYWPGNYIFTLSGVTESGSTVFSSGDTVYVKGMEGLVIFNNRDWAIASVGEAITETGVTIEITNELFSHSGTTYTQGGTVQRYTNQITGLDHLANVNVSLVGGGSVLDDQQVSSGGTVAFTQYYRVIHAGLPYTAILETVDVPKKLGKVKRIPHIFPKFYRTCYAQFGPDEEHFDTVKFPSGETPYTGELRLNFPKGHAREQTIMFYSDQPLPMEILGLIAEVK